MRNAGQQSASERKETLLQITRVMKSGKHLSNSGNVVGNTGKVVSDTGYIVRNTGNVPGETGNVVRNTGDLVRNTGKLLFASGDPLFMCVNQLQQFKKLGRRCDFGTANRDRLAPGTPAA